MARWVGLDAVVTRLRKFVEPELRKYGGVPDQRLRQVVEALVDRCYPSDVRSDRTQYSAATNVMTMLVLSGAQPPTWLCRPSASAVVVETDVRSIPIEPPKMLRRAGIIEARRPETGERLWGDISSLGWYSIDETYWLIGLMYPDGHAIVKWRPRWTGEDLDAQLPALDPTALVDPGDRSTYYDFGLQAASYLLTLGLLAEVPDGPLRIELDKRETRERRRRIIDVFFDDDRGKKKRPDAPPAPLLDGPVAQNRSIRGHLKRVWVGPGRSKPEWRYVHLYRARRWLSPRWLVSAIGTGEIA